MGSCRSGKTKSAHKGIDLVYGSQYRVIAVRIEFSRQIDSIEKLKPREEGPEVLSKTAEYALRAITSLAAQSETPKSADALAKITQVPRAYLQRVLQDLTASGLIVSRPGPGGGYLLQQAPESISILAVVNAVSPIERIRRCPLGLKSHIELCPLHREIDNAYAATETAFRGVTVSDILKSTSAIKPLVD